MSDIMELRRENGRRVIERAGGVGKVAKRMGQANASFLVQQFGPNPSRNITEKTARRMEAALGLQPGELDRPPSTAAPSDEAVGLVSDVIRLVGAVLESESMQLPPKRFADVVALAYSDSVEHGGAPREGHVRSLVRLLK